MDTATLDGEGSSQIRFSVFDLQKMQCSLMYINEVHKMDLMKYLKQRVGEMKEKSVLFILFPRRIQQASGLNRVNVFLA